MQQQKIESKRHREKYAWLMQIMYHEWIQTYMDRIRINLAAWLPTSHEYIYAEERKYTAFTEKSNSF